MGVSFLRWQRLLTDRFSTVHTDFDTAIGPLFSLLVRRLYVELSIDDNSVSSFTRRPCLMVLIPYLSLLAIVC